MCKGTKYLLGQRLVRLGSTSTIQEAFAEHIQPNIVTKVLQRIPRSLPKMHTESEVSCSSSMSRKSGGKEVSIAENITLVIDFGCWYLWFTVQATIDKPHSKKVCMDHSAFDILMSSAACGNAKEEVFNDVLDH